MIDALKAPTPAWQQLIAHVSNDMGAIAHGPKPRTRNAPTPPIWGLAESSMRTSGAARLRYEIAVLVSHIPDTMPDW